MDFFLLDGERGLLPHTPECWATFQMQWEVFLSMLTRFLLRMGHEPINDSTALKAPSAWKMTKKCLLRYSCAVFLNPAAPTGGDRGTEGNWLFSDPICLVCSAKSEAGTEQEALGQ